MAGTETGVAENGCLCGTVRDAVRAAVPECDPCQRRMDQKASGGPVMVVIAVPAETAPWTRGSPARSRSPTIATHGFGRDCDTTPTYKNRVEHLSLSHGSLDDPPIIAPTNGRSSQTGLPWCECADALPIEPMAAWIAGRGIDIHPLPHPATDR